jgi:hypothetical protein
MSYANVVATLALFIALGGTGYAAAQIDSGDVKNRSLKGGDLKLNTLTGREINEGRIGQVPAARNAVNAGTADLARASDTATTATSAQTALRADAARDAQTVGGLPSGVFERSSRTAFGAAPVNPSSEDDEQTLVSWPELGAELRTATSQGQCANGFRLAFRNTRSTGGQTVFLFEHDDSGSIAGPVAGEIQRFCTVQSTNEFQGVAWDTNSSRALFIDCRRRNSELRCLATRSET